LKELELHRITQSDTGTLGYLLLRNRILCVTLELPWKNNKQHVSRIPQGSYLCNRIESPRFGWTYHVVGVPDRGEIIFHEGNTIADTRGCILCGSWIAPHNSQFTICKSLKAKNTFLESLRQDPRIALKIVDSKLMGAGK